MGELSEKEHLVRMSFTPLSALIAPDVAFVKEEEEMVVVRVVGEG